MDVGFLLLDADEVLTPECAEIDARSRREINGYYIALRMVFSWAEYCSNDRRSPLSGSALHSPGRGKEK